MQTTRVWDLPTRIFHWSLFLAIVGSIISAKVGGNAMIWHMRLGMFVATLLLWRVVWGLIGGHYSKFISFIYSPSTVLAYLRGQAPTHVSVGHNPMGAMSVFGLLAVLVIQVASGLVSDDEIATVGPLNKFVSSAIALQATGWHKAYGQWLLLALIGLHVAAILFYLFKKRENLIRPMIHGDKAVESIERVPSSRDDLNSRLTALAVWVVCAAAVAFVAIRWG